MPAVLGADAGWDVLLGVALFLAPWLVTASMWPVFVMLGAGCFVFAVVLARAARGHETVTITRLAVIGNIAATTVSVVVVCSFRPSPGITAGVIIAAVGCAAFAALEWLAARPL